MVGGTKLPPQDSESGPWSHEQSKSKSNSNPKTFPEEESQNPSRVDVSLDNADTVIEGGPHQRGSISERRPNRSGGAPPLALREVASTDTQPSQFPEQTGARRDEAVPKMGRPSGAGFLRFFSRRSNHKVSFVTAGMFPDCLFKFSKADWRECQDLLRPCGVAYILSTKPWSD